ncbi:MAG: hypothetical protein HYU41_05835 [Candidatus Rokubacteria bacterium]|nr:hypothetical protein [Candidatus Rokubacteria bacterium]
MLPQLTSDGVLPPGVHPATLDEIAAVFATQTAIRRNLGSRLRRILALAQQTGQLRKAFVWGSFPTAKPDPADIDIMLVMSAAFRSEECASEVRQVFDGEIAERILGATILWIREDVPSELVDSFLEQWQIDRGGRRRGIVEVVT